MRIAVVAMHPLDLHNGGTGRVERLARDVQGSGHEVILVHPSGDAPDRFADFERVGYESVSLGQSPMPSWLRALKRRFAPLPTVAGATGSSALQVVEACSGVDLVCVPFPLSADFRTQLPIWADFHDVMSRYALHESRRRTAPEARLGLRLQAAAFRRSERNVVRRAVVVSAAGCRDALELGALSEKPTAWIPVSADVQENFGDLAPSGGTPTAGLLADFRYEPNRDAYKFLVSGWSSALRARGWRIVVAGHESNLLPQVSGVTCLGAVGSVREFYSQVGLALAPVRTGGGIKVKIVEALAFGRPVLATAFALDGFAEEGVRGAFTFEVDGVPTPAQAAAAPARLPAELTTEGVARRISELLSAAVRAGHNQRSADIGSDGHG